MNTKSFLVCFMVVMMATSVALAGGHHGNFGGGFARGGNGSFHGGNWHGGNWNHCHGGHSSFVFIGGFPFFGYPYGYGYGYGYPYGYGYGYGPGYYGYGSGYYGTSYYGNGYYGNRYYGSGYGYSGRRSSVVSLQRQLARAGYYRGPIDGIMGARTRYALRAYQHDRGTASL